MIKKIYTMFFILNILFTVLLVGNYLFIYNYTILSIPLFIFVLIGLIFVTAIFFKHKRDHDKYDLKIMIIYIIFSILIVIISFIYQLNNNEVNSLLYFQQYLIIPNIIYLLSTTTKASTR